MKIYNPGITLFFLLFCLPVSGQTVYISGSGSGYQNAELKFYSQTDPVTKRLKPLLGISCDEKGSFSVELPCPKSEIIFIKAGTFKFRLYVTENLRYQLLFPNNVPKSESEEQNLFFIETELMPEVVNSKNDINNFIRIFDSEYNPVFNLVAERVFRNFKMDELQQEISKLDKFTEVPDLPFYNDYLKCRMTMLKLVASSATQYKTVASEFINSWFKSDNQAFCDLAEQMYSGYFNKFLTGPLKADFNRAIALGSFTELRSVIMQDGKITNKELADFVALLNLNANYYDRSLPGENIRKIISIMKSQGETVSVKNIASVVLDKLNSSLPGNYPTDFSLLNNDGKLMSLKDFRGKYLLLCFARSDNPASLIELGIINTWYKKYVKDVQVVTILADNNFKTASALTKNRGLNWIFLDGSNKDNLEFNYDLKMYPSFLLLDRAGKIIADPCSYPSEDIELTINNILLADPDRSGSENR
jgi:peroxiredoxin